MKTIGIVLEKIYLLLISLTPLLASYVYGTFPSAKACNTDGICFESGGAIINGETEAIFYLSVLLLWPMCIWLLVGKHIVTWRPRPSSDSKSILSVAIVVFGKLYWLIVAAIPLLFWYMFGTFLAPHDCAVDRSCFQFYTPLSRESKIAVLIACCILWPMCLWKLFGGKARRSSKADAAPHHHRPRP
jgi:hypothetical protein